MVAGPQQDHQLIARARAPIAVERHADDSVFPTAAFGARDLHIFDGAGRFFVLVANFLEAIDDKGDIPEANDVVRPHSAFARAQAGAIEKRTVGAAQIADAPTAAGGADFCMPATDGRIVQDNFQRGQTAGAQDIVGFPDLSFNVAVDATQANASFHGDTPLRMPQ